MKLRALAFFLITPIAFGQNVNVQKSQSGGSGNANVLVGSLFGVPGISLQVTQTNSFTIGEAICNVNGTWTAADQTTAPKVDGLVIATGNPFLVQFGGSESTITGLSASTQYYLGAAGALTSTQTTTVGHYSVPVLNTGTTGNGVIHIGAPAQVVILSVPNGGTGQTTLTAGGVLYGSGTAAIGQTAAGAAGTVLVGGSTPSFSTSLPANVTATAPTTASNSSTGAGYMGMPQNPQSANYTTRRTTTPGLSR